MNLLVGIKKMNWSRLGSLLRLCLSHPLYVIPSYTATRKTVAVCDTEFGNKHHQNGKANAFRHALWNALIILKSIRWGAAPLRAAAWAKKLTDWHEEFSPNTPLAEAMDLHNNRIGRDYALTYPKVSELQMIQLIFALIPLSRKHPAIASLTHFPNQLAHIEDD